MPSMRKMNGIIIVNKPQDFTSFDVVAVVRKLLNEKKVGHTGTLDPMATGVLPILIGRATKLQRFILESNKEYVADFKLGIRTDTLDTTGKILSSFESNVKKNEFEKILPNFRGNISQIPPMFSAVQKNGVRLYNLARKGLEVTRDPRKISINKLQLLDFDETSQKGTLLVNCSKGTYIRTLCDDIGQKLGCGAVLTALKRVKACGFDIKDSVTLDKAKDLTSKNELSKYILPCDILFQNCTKVCISSAQANRFKNGGSLCLDRLHFSATLSDEQVIGVYNADIGFIGLGKINLNKNELAVACLVEI